MEKKKLKNQNTSTRGSGRHSRHRNRRRRRCRSDHNRRSTMEGIRLRSDSTGSTKNAFYQGTIVSDSRHANEFDNDRQSLKSDSQDSIPRRRRKAKTDYFLGKHPPLPRSYTGHYNVESKKDTYDLISPEDSQTEHGRQVFEFSTGSQDLRLFGDGQSALASRQHQESMRYSMNSFMSTSSKQLFGTNLLNDDGSRESGGDSYFESDTDNALPGVAKSHAADEFGGSLSGGRFEKRRSSASGVYFNQFAPPGPLFPGMSGGNNHPPFQHGSTLPNNGPSNVYPTQQASYNLHCPNYGSINVNPDSKVPFINSKAHVPKTIEEDDESSRESKRNNSNSNSSHIAGRFDLSGWLSKDVVYDNEGVPYFESTTKWTLAGTIRWLFYNPIYPEFTSLQQFCWAVVLGVFMGVFTAGWKLLIDACVECTWKTIPEKLLEWGFFTDLDGALPLYHYMWITPGLLSGILTYISHSLPTPIPTQDDWIHTLHSNGIQESDTFIPTFVVSTMGMTSGLSLGPELPLILTAGMIGSWLGRVCRQSLLQARVMNLTAASAAIGGMFGFPLAGGIFVMEVPHRMGLQYFEALSPATIASIVAVLINRIVIDNDVTGMFQYPFLSESLPSFIFKDAIVYGLFGGALGIFYTFNVKRIKKFMHHLLDCCGDVPISDDSIDVDNVEDFGESTPFVNAYSASEKTANANQTKLCSPFAGLISHTPTRAALTSALAGILVGITGIFLPHVMFWGEAQLQTMIDKRKTPLPIFGQGDEPTADLVALGQCMMDQSQESFLSIRCSIAIVLAKIFVTGLSLGTGIVGGHFWAPLFVGATASQFFTEAISISSEWLGISTTLTQYPCVALLCIMGATHVVTFRAHMAIILILTLTIDAFVPEDYALRNIRVAGDYSAVFPLLTVAVFVALQISRQTTFYEKQRSRGDIQALPEALCEPGKEGKPLVMDYEGKLHALDDSDYEYETDYDSDDDFSDSLMSSEICGSLSQDDIEANFQEKNKYRAPSPTINTVATSSSVEDSKDVHSVNSGTPPKKLQKKTIESKRKKRIQVLDNLLNGPIPTTPKRDPPATSAGKKKKTHRRTQSEPFLLDNIHQRADSMFDSSTDSSCWKKPVLKRVDSYGEIDQGQPSLMDQARLRAASVAKADNGNKKKY